MTTLFGEASPLDRARGDDSLTDFHKKVADALNNPVVHMLLLQQFKEYMTQYMALNQPAIPISQIFGFDQFTVKPATKVNTSETTTSGSYTDLATVGPTLTGLPDGQYLILHGCNMITSAAGSGVFQSVQVNATGASDDDAVVTTSTQSASNATAIVKTLSNDGNNTLTAKYRVGAVVTGEFARRWLIALRYANS